VSGRCGYRVLRSPTATSLGNRCAALIRQCLGVCLLMAACADSQTPEDAGGVSDGGEFNYLSCIRTASVELLDEPSCTDPFVLAGTGSAGVCGLTGSTVVFFRGRAISSWELRIESPSYTAAIATYQDEACGDCSGITTGGGAPGGYGIIALPDASRVRVVLQNGAPAVLRACAPRSSPFP